MPKRILIGRVTSVANNKTATVVVERRYTHPVLLKTVKRTKKYRAHDENNACVLGQTVQIRESSPFSLTKRWEVIGLGKEKTSSDQPSNN